MIDEKIVYDPNTGIFPTDRFKYRCSKGHEWNSSSHAEYSILAPDGTSRIVCLKCVIDLLPEVVKS